jgi:hypothetical protein
VNRPREAGWNLEVFDQHPVPTVSRECVAQSTLPAVDCRTSNVARGPADEASPDHHRKAGSGDRADAGAERRARQGALLACRHVFAAAEEACRQQHAEDRRFHHVTFRFSLISNLLPLRQPAQLRLIGISVQPQPRSKGYALAGNLILGLLQQPTSSPYRWGSSLRALDCTLE